MSAIIALAIIAGIFSRLATTSPILTIPNSNLPTYDAIIVGGGPAGLSAASALGRVRRSALLFDSGVYRNAQTKQMHDIIGNDGTVPSAFRALARSQIAPYTSVTMTNGTVVSIIPSTTSNSTYFTTTDANGQQYVSKKVILATGFKDILPSTPGLAANFGLGIYWCPWCDGWEHKDAPLANLGQFTPSLIQSTIALTTLNANPLILANTSYTPLAADQATAKIPNWEQQLAVYGIEIDNREIVSFERVDGNEDDLKSNFLITFADGGTLVRNAIKANFPAELASDLPKKMGLVLEDGADGSDVHVVVDGHMESSMPGVFVVGDANSDKSANVPHAMWSAKRAAVYMHGVLAKEYANALVGSIQHTRRSLEIHENFEAMKRELAQPLAEDNSADELLEYLKR